MCDLEEESHSYESGHHNQVTSTALGHSPSFRMDLANSYCEVKVMNEGNGPWSKGEKR